MRLTAFILALSGICPGQSLTDPTQRPRSLGEVPRVFTASCTAVLTASAAGACTIQQSAAGTHKIRVIWAQVLSTVAVDITQERNGTAATATSVTIKRLNPDKPDAATAVVYGASDVGVGTVIVPATTIPAGVSTVTLGDTYLIGAGTAKNYTIRPSSITGTFSVTFKFEEYD